MKVTSKPHRFSLLDETNSGHILPAAAILLFGCILMIGCSEGEGLRQVSPAGGTLRTCSLVPLPLGSIEPQGWLKEQLKIQIGGLTGHLDEFWPDVKESGWIGGHAEGWERLPYWLDGAVPLAYLLKDEKLKARVEKYIDYILQHQSSDGWLGPEQSETGDYKPRDPWPVFVMGKVLTQYYEATGDSRVLDSLRRFFRTLNIQLERKPLFDWNRMRWQDGAVTVYWLYEKTGESWLLDLAAKLHDQGYDWRSHFADLPHKAKVEKWEHESHVVNNAMGIKAPAVWYRQSSDPKDRDAVAEAIAALDDFHGQASGLFSGDECFAGKMPSQGTETCAVVEYMYSLETALSVVPEAVLGDRLEKIAFNALPAAFKPDMWARQYVQQANQVVAKRTENPIYTTNGELANVFGLETNYGCCTANMHQGWPKFVAHLWMKTNDGGLAAVAYAPSRIEAQMGEVPTRIELKTDYPFGEELFFRVSVEAPVSFPLKLRIPRWVEQGTVRIAGEKEVEVRGGEFYTLDREWVGETEVFLKLPMKLRAERRCNNALSLSRGPLVFSLKIGEEWRKVAGEEPHADWEVYPTTPWNWALDVTEESLEDSVQVETGPLRGNPFEAGNAPVRLKVNGRRLPGWKLVRGAAAPPPPSPVKSAEPLQSVTLIPYGSAKLRITEFPTLR